MNSGAKRTRKFVQPLPWCPKCGCAPPVHSANCPSVHAVRVFKTGHKPKPFSVHAALTYAVDHMRGCNPEIGPASAIGNVKGAARLCAWALEREADLRP